MKTAGKVWVVTGGGNGMGRELVLELLRRGARVAAVDVRGDALAETAALTPSGDRLSLHVLDVTDVVAARALVDDVVVAHGSVDGLLNNAGIVQPFRTVADLDDAAIRRVLDVNLMGPITMVRAFLPTLMTRPEAHIANVSSMGGFFPFPGQTIYGASKAGVKLLSEGLYLELAETPVRVSVIFPGAVRTEITKNSGVTMAVTDAGSTRMPMTAPDAAARMMLDGIEKDKYHIYVGRDALLMSLAVKIAPRQAALLVARQMRRLLTPADAGADARA